MTTILHVFTDGDLLEVSVRDDTIIRLERFVGPEQLYRSVNSFDDLTPEEKAKVVDAFCKRLEQHEGNSSS